MTQQVVYAIHNFDAENDDEINFRVGDPIVVLERDDKYMDGWWQGRNVQGHVGLFPMNYISTEKPRQNNNYSSQSMHNTFSTTSTTTSSSLSDRDLEHKIDSTITHVTHATSTVGGVEFGNTRPEEWTVSQVASWLDSIGHGSVAHLFIEQEISGDILLDLNMEALKEFGISAYGKRYKIMHAITSLNTIAPPPPKNQQRPPSRVLSTKGGSGGGGGGPPSPVESDGYRSRNATATTPASSDDHLSPLNIASPARPISPQSLGTSPIVSRSNTFNTVSSKKSNSSSGTVRSSSDDQNNGVMMPRTKTTSLFSKKGGYPNQHQPDMDGEATYSSATSSIYKNDWMTESNISSSGSSFEDHSMEPGGSAVRKMSVASADPTVNQPDGFQAPEHEGWLHKQGDKYKTWNKRWFVLKGINLFYFKSPKDVRMKGIINLRGYRIIVDESIHSSKYCFKAQHDRERTFYFYTDSQESMRKWVNVLMKTTIARDISSRRMRPRPPSMIMYNNGNGTTTVQTKNARPHTELMHDPKMTMLQEEEEYSQQQPASMMDPHIEWVNGHLSQPINDLSSAFRDGERLVELLESLSGKHVRRPPPPEDGCQSDMYMLDTIVAAFKFMGREGVQVNGEFTIKDVFAGDVSKITKMLDAIQDWSAQ
ncbi:phospholipid binding [Lichtheimia corymbifera JMRC:FSU:9682]|uniref:Phospholipid binding n=1 Tax=Lichtheimia corymbifera JMRC:FSU:9682 TaxID=1263082 RepID=A0A068RQI7_9FUNG|nr:phospholipid binding [Lichtheimia corymbifera JMRC:FSU:9682]